MIADHISAYLDTHPKSPNFSPCNFNFPLLKVRKDERTFYATVIFLKIFNANRMSCVLNFIKTCANWMIIYVTLNTVIKI